MRLLFLTSTAATSAAPGSATSATAPGNAALAALAALPALDLLPHEVTVAAIEHPLQALVSHETGAAQAAAGRARGTDADHGAGHEGSRTDAILLDGTRDPRSARTAALALDGRTSAPRIAILREAALTVLSPEWGVADFLTPEAGPAEAEARLRLLIAYANAETSAGSQGAVEASGVEIDESNFVAKVHGRTLDLTYKEYELLHFLALHPARVFTRDQLLSEVWGTDYYGGTRTVDVHVRRLRAKLGEHESLISTVRGVGYGFARGRQE